MGTHGLKWQRIAMFHGDKAAFARWIDCPAALDEPLSAKLATSSVEEMGRQGFRQVPIDQPEEDKCVMSRDLLDAKES